jgi:hypothetical protein
MTEATGLLPITDVIAEMQKQLSVRLERPNLIIPEHVHAGHRLNEETAAASQVSISSDTPTPDPADVEKSWVNGELGYFRFVTTEKGKIIGGVWSLADTHTLEANRALQETDVGITLSSDATKHREASSYIFEGTRGVNADQADIDASTLQLAEEFGLDGVNKHPVDTIAVYMDGVEGSDRDMMGNLGFTVSADGVNYEGSEPCSVFVATKKSVEQAIRKRATKMGISGTYQLSAALK